MSHRDGGARLFYPPFLVMRAGRMPDGKPTVGADLSAFQILVEEMIVGWYTHRILLRSRSLEGANLQALPMSSRRRVDLVDPGERVVELTMQLLSPVRNELGVEARAIEVYAVPSGMPQSLRDGVARIHRFVHGYLSAAQFKAHLDLDIPATVRDLQQVRSELTNAAGRAVLAELEGILAAYQTVQLDGIQVRDDLAGNVRGQLVELLQTEEHADLAYQGLILAESGKIEAVASAMGRRVRSLLANSRWQAVIEYASRVMSVYTGVPTLRVSEWLAALPQPSSFLPVVVSLSDARSRAFSRWCAMSPQMLPAVPLGVEHSNVMWSRHGKLFEGEPVDAGEAARAIFQISSDLS